MLFGLVDHLPSECRHRRGDLKTRQLTHRGAREAIDRVGGDLQGQLTTVEHHFREWVLRSVHVLLGTLSRSQQLGQHQRQHTLSVVLLDEAVADGRLGVLVRVHLGHVLGRDEGAVAQIVRHHDGGVQRREVERGDRLPVEVLLRLQHGRTLELFLGRFLFSVWEDVPQLEAGAVELAHDLDLLTTCEQVAERRAGDPGHLHVVVHAQQVVHQTQRQGGLL
mmetsp:Transcript_13693/g.39479  ORF Transcript_13693/g.39479 Transcript_13693/m.39479 type:complete len:221 (+) Transcript_13693:3262-3924(+)